MDSVGSLLNRPRLYYNIDGVGELGMGFMGLAVGLFLSLQAHSPKDAVWHRMYTFVVYWTAMCLTIHYGSKAIKNRITYPRTGFVEYPAWESKWRPAIIAALVAAPVSAGIAFAMRSQWKMSTPLAFIGVLLAASYAYGFARTVRWKWTIAAALTAGSVVVAFLPADLLCSVAGDSRPIPAQLAGTWILTFLLYGALLSISGGISFWLYMRHTRPPEPDAQ